MDERSVKLQGLLFAAGRPLFKEELEALLEIDPDKLELAIDGLKNHLKGGALEVKVISGEVQMRLKDEFIPLAESVARAAMDKDVLKTASLIGYYQPLLQSDLVNMVGTKAYSHVALLREMELVNSQREGRSFMLTATPKFAQYFGIEAEDSEGIKQYLAKKLGM